MSPSRPFRTGWRRGEKTAAKQVAGEDLDWALEDFSGDIAADELYDGPFCILSIVDKSRHQRITELFEHRHLFVPHELTTGERKTLPRITRGLPQLRILREIVNEVYRLFDRRCSSETALAKLAPLRRRVRRFKAIGRTLQKLFSPNIEKALVFLDDSLLPSTSNAVERGNRRHRKMQKSVYRVRSLEHVSHRIALDMQRDARMPKRFLAIATLHRERAG